MATTNLFKNAKTLEAKGATAKKAAKTKTLVEGLELYAAIDHASKWLKTLLETAKSAVAESVTDKFIADGINDEVKLANFDGEEGKATGNIQLKKRSSASGLNDIELAILDRYDISVKEVEDRPETYIINPVHLGWLAKNGDKLSKFISKLDDAPADLFLFQESTKKTITTDTSIDEVFQKYASKPHMIRHLLPVVTTLAIKPTFDEGSDNANEKALSVIKAFIGKKSYDKRATRNSR